MVFFHHPILKMSGLDGTVRNSGQSGKFFISETSNPAVGNPISLLFDVYHCLIPHWWSSRGVSLTTHLSIVEDKNERRHLSASSISFYVVAREKFLVLLLV